MWSSLAALTALSFLLSPISAIYFYIDGTTPKCFYEELPKDTLVTGTYKASAYNTNSQSYIASPDLSIQVTVDETFDNDQRVVTQTSVSSSSPKKFTFTAHDAGLHRLCFMPSGSAAISLSGWFSSGGQGEEKGGVKIELDIAIGEGSKIESEDKAKLEGIVGKVKELNARLGDVRREQVFQRVRVKQQGLSMGGC